MRHGGKAWQRLACQQAGCKHPKDKVEHSSSSGKEEEAHDSSGSVGAEGQRETETRDEAWIRLSQQKAKLGK
eukprot:1101285-Amphidinium_carterae.1